MYPPGRAGVSDNSVNKIEYCRNFMRGACRFGENCVYVHSSNDMRRNALDQTRVVLSDGVDRNWDVLEESIPRKGICRYFYSTGNCHFGDQCRFEHQRPERVEEIQDMSRESSAISIPTTDLDVNANTRFKTRLCENWMRRNSCGYGANCTFAHGQAELVQSHSTVSEPRNSSNVPETQEKDASPSYAGGLTVEQRVPRHLWLKNLRNKNKITGIYADWLEDM